MGLVEDEKETHRCSESTGWVSESKTADSADEEADAEHAEFADGRTDEEAEAEGSGTADEGLDVARPYNANEMDSSKKKRVLDVQQRPCPTCH